MKHSMKVSLDSRADLTILGEGEDPWDLAKFW